LILKITASVSWFRPQNQAGFGLLAAQQNQSREDGAGHASRSDGLLRHEASRARVFQSGLKTNGGATMGGARGIIARLRRVKAEDGRVDATGYVGPSTPKTMFSIYYALGTI
jgi:hypothetical protein